MRKKELGNYGNIYKTKNQPLSNSDGKDNSLPGLQQLKPIFPRKSLITPLYCVEETVRETSVQKTLLAAQQTFRT